MGEFGPKPLLGHVAVVAGGSRGAGRGIAFMLGEAGATVYVTGRSVKGRPSPMGRPETIEETAEFVSGRGGTGIPVRVNHTSEEEVRALFERIRMEQNGRLDLVVNDVWGGDPLTEWKVPFWEQTLDKGLFLQKQAVHSHIITSRYAAPLMVRNNSGLIVEVTDGTGYKYRKPGLFYSLAKISAVHLAEAMAADFRKCSLNIAAVAITPGFLRSEALLEQFGVTEENWRDAIRHEGDDWAASESTSYIGRAVVALARDPKVAQKNGGSFTTWQLAAEYGFTDIDGTRPDFWGHLAAKGEG